MASTVINAPQMGSPSAEEIYAAAGVALSYWAAAEDVQMSVFVVLCGEAEPTAFETYVSAPRKPRNEMLASAMKRYSFRFQGDEIERVLKAMKALDKLAAIRNEIAHGHCSKRRETKDGNVVVDGHFLVPSLNESIWQAKQPRFAHTATSMYSFTEDVRKHRGSMMDVWRALQMRAQEVYQLGAEVQLTIQRAKMVASGQIPPGEILNHLRLVDPPKI